jgi:hypothetical protein
MECVEGGVEVSLRKVAVGNRQEGTVQAGRIHAIVAPLCRMSAQPYRIVAAARVLRSAAELSALQAAPPRRRRLGVEDGEPKAGSDPAGEQGDGRPGDGRGGLDGVDDSDGSTVDDDSHGGFDSDELDDSSELLAGGCEGECRPALLASPSRLCNGCRVPPGGRAFLWSAALPHSGTELAWAWTLARPRVLRLTPESQCWWADECWVTLGVHGPDGAEVSEHTSVLRLGPWEPAAAGAPAPHERRPAEYYGPYCLESLESGGVLC